MTETGFREKGWEVAVLEEAYQDHASGWDHFLPRLVRVRHPTGVGPRERVVDDDLWSAIGDPTRRRMLDLLLADGAGTATVAQRAAAGDPPGRRQAPGACSTGSGWSTSRPPGGRCRYQVDEAQLARAVAQLAAVGATWDARLRRIKRIAEAIQRTDAATRNQTTEQQRRREEGHDGHPAQDRREVGVARRGLRRP